MGYATLIAKEKVEEVSIKTNPVFFGDFSLGYTNGGIQGFSVTGSLNYQKKNLFTFRTLQVLHIERIDFFILFPTRIDFDQMSEYSLLYGKRMIENGFSYYISGGISFASCTHNYQGEKLTIDYVGFPIEAGISWFKNKKNGLTFYMDYYLLENLLALEDLLDLNYMLILPKNLM